MLYANFYCSLFSHKCFKNANPNPNSNLNPNFNPNTNPNPKPYAIIFTRILVNVIR